MTSNTFQLVGKQKRISYSRYVISDRTIEQHLLKHSMTMIVEK
ncbi:MAG TPA: hypothetical protein VHJ38_19545 [Nitrososphaeraceae archaeon]|nr:hypothetical protein [Nitrososphaeraceae archaeon]